MNIIWQQPSGAIAVTSIFDGSSPQDHAQQLLAQGDVPADWKAVAYGVEDFPPADQETWRFDATARRIIVDLQALNALRNRQIMQAVDQVEQAQQMPRALRDLILAQGDRHPAYPRAWEVQQQIKTLRAGLVTP